MSRLIDAEELLKEFNPNGEPIDPITVRMRIVQQPTVYDVDKVVKQLEESYFLTESTFDDDGWCNDDSEEVVNLNEAIEIIKRGGIDE